MLTKRRANQTAVQNFESGSIFYGPFMFGPARIRQIESTYLLSLISFSSQYRKAAKTSLEIVYIFSINVRVSKLIPITRYTVKEKLMPDIYKVTKVVTSLRWKNFPLQSFRVTRCCSSARIRNKL